MFGGGLSQFVWNFPTKPPIAKHCMYGAMRKGGYHVVVLPQVQRTTLAGTSIKGIGVLDEFGIRWRLDKCLHTLSFAR